MGEKKISQRQLQDNFKNRIAIPFSKKNLLNEIYFKNNPK